MDSIDEILEDLKKIGFTETASVNVVCNIYDYDIIEVVEDGIEKLAFVRKNRNLNKGPDEKVFIWAPISIRTEIDEQRFHVESLEKYKKGQFTIESEGYLTDEEANLMKMKIISVISDIEPKDAKIKLWVAIRNKIRECFCDIIESKLGPREGYFKMDPKISRKTVFFTFSSSRGKEEFEAGEGKSRRF